MKSYEETIRSVHSKISMYEAERKRKRASAAGIAAAAAPVCVIAAAGAVLWRHGGFAPTAVQQVSDPPVIPVTAMTAQEPAESAASAETPSAPQQTAAVIAEPSADSSAAETRPQRDEPTAAVPQSAEKPQVTEPAGNDAAPHDLPQSTAAAVTGTVPQTAAETAAATRPGTAPVSETVPAAVQGPMLREGDEPPVPRRIITSYPVGCSADYPAPKDGEIMYTVPLAAAMKEYGADEDTDYLVILELYSENGTELLSDYASIKAEHERLGALGYIAGLNMPSGSRPFLTLHATYEELQNFPAEPNRGYFMKLYHEGEEAPLPTVNNVIF